jgi:hypothetical protein
MTSEQKRRIPLEEAFRIATGKEPPVITPEQQAQYDAEDEAVSAEARRIWGEGGLGRPSAA